MLSRQDAGGASIHWYILRVCVVGPCSGGGCGGLQGLDAEVQRERVGGARRREQGLGGAGGTVQGMSLQESVVE